MPRRRSDEVELERLNELLANLLCGRGGTGPRLVGDQKSSSPLEGAPAPAGTGLSDFLLRTWAAPSRRSAAARTPFSSMSRARTSSRTSSGQR